MEYMQAAAIFLGELDGRERRFKTGLLVPDQGMIRGHQFMSVPPYSFEVLFDDPFRFTMGGDQYLALPEKPVERQIIIHQQIARRSPHKDLDPAYVFFPFIGPQRLF